MNAPWLTGVLTRGETVDLAVPWRPTPAESWDVDLRDGVVRRVVGDVLVAGDVEVDADVRAQALALLVPAGVVVLGVAAVWVHAGHPVPPPQRVVVSGRQSRTPPARPPGAPVVVTSRVRPDPAEVTTVGRLRVSTPARALLDAAAADPHRAARWGRVLTGAGLLDEAAVRGASSGAHGRTGVRVARRALSLPRSATPRTLSPSAASTP